MIRRLAWKLLAFEHPMRSFLFCRTYIAVASVLVAANQSFALNTTLTTINFDGLPDSTAVGDTYASAGIHFAHGIALTAGVSLNEIQFPPHSGTGVLADGGSTIVITFDSAASGISAYFAHLNQLTFTAFDAGGGLLGTYSSPLTSFTGGTEQIGLGFSGVSELDISAQTPSTYMLDDLSFQTGATPSGVPDSGSTLTLLAMAGLALLGSAKLLSKQPLGLVKPNGNA
jgi:hypothetical protein